MQSSEPDQFPKSRILSPFSDAEGPVAPKKAKSNLLLWISLAGIFLVILAVGGFFLASYLNDPLRTLEPFPVAKYMDDYRALAGSRFQAGLRVENDLGWKEGVGRIMVFTMESDPRPIAVMIPSSLASIYFVKGQRYAAELEVKEGGLIYANSCRKN